MRLVIAVLGLVACGSDTPPESDASTGDSAADGPSTSSPSGTTTPVTTSTTDPGATTGSGSSESSEAGNPPVMDVLRIPDMPIPEEDGCQAIDFLFVIDDSGSMLDEQMNLANNFPTFSDTIQATLKNVTSYQVGVVATDAYVFNDPPCGQLGDLVISTQGGFDSSNMVCGPYAAGKNFMTEEDDLGESFACAARLGTGGDGSERPLEAMMNTLGDQNDGTGECNEDFIRDEALLVVVIITDEWDGPNDPEGVGTSSMGDPETWYEAVLDAKGGIEQNAVVMSLINFNEGEGEDESPCPPLDPTSDGQNIKEFTELFEENGFVGGICETDYGPIFQDAINVIDTACQNFIPPG